MYVSVLVSLPLGSTDWSVIWIVASSGNAMDSLVSWYAIIGPGMKVFNCKIVFSYPSIQSCPLGAQKNPLIETVL